MTVPKYSADPIFVKVAPLVLNVEGGYVNDPHDPGGPTMRGIAWNYNSGWLIKHGYRRDTIRKLTKEDALQCYYEKYWLPATCNLISDVDLAYIHFDAAVNCGVGQANTFLNRLGTDPRHFDFSNGKNRTLAIRLFLEYTAQRLSFYTHAKGRDHYLAGWINRMASVVKNAAGLD